jgi:peptidoglycan hydrolase-like protein with peptidoglycan-binding domain
MLTKRETPVITTHVRRFTTTAALASVLALGGVAVTTASAEAAPLAGHTAAAQAAGFSCGFDDRATPSTISRGAKGDTVREAQCLLISLGFGVGPHGIDGDFGADTEKAVKAFQKKYGVPGGADGVVGKNTWYGLRNY